MGKFRSRDLKRDLHWIVVEIVVVYVYDSVSVQGQELMVNRLFFVVASLLLFYPELQGLSLSE